MRRLYRLLATISLALFTLSSRAASMPPAAPSPQSPGSSSSSGQTVTDSRPTFQWSSVSGATKYGFYLAVEPYGASNIVYETESLTTTSVRLPSGNALQAGKRYRWNVRAYNSTGWSGYSSQLYIVMQSAQPPAAPVTSSPGSTSSPGPEITTLTPTLQWGSVSGATSYLVTIKDVATGAFPIDDVQVSGSAVSYTVPSGKLQAGRSYVWDMVARNSAGTSARATDRYFRTQGAPLPGAPAIVSPRGTQSAPAQLTNTTVRLDWNSTSNAVSYRAFISRSSTQNGTYTPISGSPFNVGTATEYTFTGQTGYYYKWTADAVNSSGQDGGYDGNHFFYISTAEPRPSEPTNLTPGVANSAPGTSVSAGNVTLRWDAVSSATNGYKVTVTHATNSSFTDASTLIDDQATATNAYTVSVVTGRFYRWNVVAVNRYGQESTIPPRHFFYVPATVAVPPAPTNPSPGTSSAPGTAFSAGTQTLSWTAASGATSYSLYVTRATDAGFTVPDRFIRQQNVGNVVSYPLTLEAGYYYRWQVASVNSAGEEPTGSPLRYFYVPSSTGGQLAAPSLVSPNEGATASSSTVTLQWSPVSGSESYDLAVREEGAASYAVDRTGIRGSSNPISVSVPLQPGKTYRWSVRAVASGKTPSAWAGRSFKTPQEQVVRPAITRVTSPVYATGGATAFSVYGSGFVSGATVQFRNVRTGALSPIHAPSRVTASQVDVSPEFGQEAQEWSVTVYNPGSVSSNAYTFPVLAQTTSSPPEVTGTSSFYASASRNWLSVYGRRFTRDASVLLYSKTTGDCRPCEVSTAIDASRFEYVDASHVRVKVNLGAASGDWEVTVRTAAGTSTPAYPFRVRAAQAAAPVVEDITPDHLVPDGTSSYILKITGRNFTDGRLVLSGPEALELQVVNATETEIQFRVTPPRLSSARTYRAIFNNAQGSAETSFVLEPPPTDVSADGRKRVRVGALLVSANQSVDLGGGRYSLSDNVAVAFSPTTDADAKDVLWFTGQVTVNTANPSIGGTGEIAIRPLNGTRMPVWNGDFLFDVAQAVLKAPLPRLNESLLLAGFPLSVDRISVGDGFVELDAQILLGNTSNAETTPIRLTKIRLSPEGMSVGGMSVSVPQSIGLGALGSLSDLNLSYQSDTRSFSGSGKMGGALFGGGKLGASVTIRERRLEAVGFQYENDPTLLPLGSTGLGLSRVYGQIEGLRTLSPVLNVGVDIEPVVVGGELVFKIQNAGVRAQGLEALSFGARALLFGQPFDASVSLLDNYSRLNATGEVVLGEYLTGKASLNARRTGANAGVNGSVAGNLVVPSSGFTQAASTAIEWMRGQRLPLPYPAGAVEGNLTVRSSTSRLSGSFSVADRRLGFSLWSEGGGLKFDVDLNVRSSTAQAFAGTQVPLQTRGQGDSLVVTALVPEAVGKDGNAEQPFALTSSFPSVLLRVEGSTSIPVPTLRLPSGRTVTPSTLGSDVRGFYVPDTRVYYFDLYAPPVGTYALSVEGGQAFSVQVLSDTWAPDILLQEAVLSSEGHVQARWVATDADDDARISLYLDRDARGNDGVMLADNLSEDQTSSYTAPLPTGLSQGDYYVYAVIEDGTHPPRVSYAPYPIRYTPAGIATPPSNVQAVEVEEGILSYWSGKSGQVYRVYAEDVVGESVPVYGGVALDSTQGVLAALPYGRTYHISIATVDPSGVSGPRSAPLSVRHVRAGQNAPFFGARRAYARVAKGESLQINAPASDLDGQVSYRLLGAPAAASVSSTGTVSWTPAPEQTGRFAFYLEASDAQSHADTLAIEGFIASEKTSTGRLRFVEPVIVEGRSFAFLQLEDQDLNLSPESMEQVNVTVINRRTGQQTTVQLREIHANAGTFTGAIPLGTSGSQALTVVKGDRLAAVYADAFPAGERTVEAVYGGTLAGGESSLVSDDFSDNMLDPANWTATGSRVAEEDGMLKVQTNVTDRGGVLQSRWMTMDRERDLRIRRRVRLHYANQYFSSQLRLFLEADSTKSFGVGYSNYSYAGGGHTATYGISMFRNGVSPLTNAEKGVNSTQPMLGGIWDTWFTEELVYNPRTGEARYFINDAQVLAYNVGALPVGGSHRFRLRQDAWGWYTGHYAHMDDFSVRQTVPVAAEEDAAPKPEGIVNLWPNPTRAAARMAFQITQPGHVRTAVYDLLGREVAVVVDEERGAGAFEVMIPTDRLAAGPYYVRLTTPKGVHTRLLIIQK